MRHKNANNPLSSMEQNAKKAEGLLKQLANHHRLMILCHLALEEMSVGELQESLKLSQSALSQHLAKMRLDGLVATEKRGQRVYYRIGNPQVKKLLETLYEIFCNEE